VTAPPLSAWCPACRELVGFDERGDPTMIQAGQIALHHRRWVTEREARRAGEPRDIRGTAEEARWLTALRVVLRAHGVPA
jgi:hypothetical protein